MFKLDLEKAEEPEIKLPTSVGSLKKREFQKNIYFFFIDSTKAFDLVDHNKVGKILQEMAAHQTPPSLGFSRQEHWNGLPFPSPMHESEK